jgi:hypothetical protein
VPGLEALKPPEMAPISEELPMLYCNVKLFLSPLSPPVFMLGSFLFHSALLDVDLTKYGLLTFDVFSINLFWDSSTTLASLTFFCSSTPNYLYLSLSLIKVSKVGPFKPGGFNGSVFWQRLISYCRALANDLN